MTYNYVVVPKTPVSVELDAPVDVEVTTDRGAKGDTGAKGDQGPAGLGAPPSGYPVLRTNLALTPTAAVTSAYISNVGSATYSKALDTTVFYSGGSSVRFTPSTNAPLGSKFAIPTGNTFATGDTLRWKLLVRPSKAINATAYWERSAPTYTGGIGDLLTVVSLPANTWTTVEGRVTFNASQAGGNTYGFGFYLQGGNSWVIGDQFWVDQCLIEVNGSSILPDHYDGTTPGARWTGTANASTSELVLPRNLRDLPA